MSTLRIDAEDRGIEADSDGQCQERRGRECGPPAQQPQCIAGIAAENVQVLARRTAQEAPEGEEPDAQQRPLATSPGGVLPLVAEVIGHRLAEISAELRRKHAQQSCEDAVVPRTRCHHTPPAWPGMSFLTCALITRSRSRSASASATFRPNGVSRYACRRSVLPATLCLIRPSASRRLMIP